MRGSPKTTAGRGTQFFARSVSGGKINTVNRSHAGSNPPSMALETSDKGRTPADTVAKGQFGRPSGKSGASPMSLINGSGVGVGASNLNTSVGPSIRKAYGKIRVR
jgi:hypothetical protein